MDTHTTIGALAEKFAALAREHGSDTPAVVSCCTACDEYHCNAAGPNDLHAYMVDGWVSDKGAVCVPGFHIDTTGKKKRPMRVLWVTP